MAASFTWHGAEVIARINAASVLGLNKAAQRLKTRAVEQTPIQDGVLRNSCQVTRAEGAGDAAMVSFDTPYAVRQHEELDYFHPQGGNSKYLERPLRESSSELRGIIAAEIRRAHE